jgi:hypothetical protein
MNTNTTPPPFLWKMEGLKEGAKKKKKRGEGDESTQQKEKAEKRH